jgi:transposase
MQYFPKASLLLLPSCTPQFSAIENMFGYTKGKMKDYIFKEYDETALFLCKLLFSYDSKRLQSFFMYSLINLFLPFI